MYAKILVLLVLAILCTGCTDPDLPNPYEFENITPGAPALHKSWNPETQTITISTLDDTPRLTIRKVSTKPDLCTFEEVLEIKSFVDYDLNKLKDFRARWKKHKGQHDITKVEWFILKNESYGITVDDYETIQVEETHYDNVTEEYYNVTVNQTVLIGNHPEVQYHDVWKPFSPVGKSIHTGQTYTVKIVYHKPPELGNVRIQTIPMFAGIECEELTWWNTSWNCRRDITINHSMVSGTQTNFPVMIAITQTGLNTDGNDTRFTDPSGNQVAREIECYDETSGELVAFFNGTSISDTVDTSFWMYYNNSAATEPAASSTYGSQAVYQSTINANWNMNNDPSGSSPQLIDSTSNNHDGTSAGGMVSGDLMDGDYGKIIDFDGGDDTISMPHSTDWDFGSGDFSILWTMKPSDAALAAGSDTVIGWHTDDGNGGWTITTEPNVLFLWVYIGSWQSFSHQTTLVAETKYSCQLVRNGSTWDFYLDGVKSTSPLSNAGAITNSASSLLYIASRYAGSSTFWDGQVGIMRIMKGTALSTDYISTHNANLNNPTATGTAPFFASFGAEENRTIITAYTPSTPLSKTSGDSQLFTVNTSENSQCRWYINGSLKQTNSTGATRHEYTNTSLDEGYWNFTATANTTDRTSSQTWWVTVNPAGTFEHDMYIDRWMYVTYLNGSNTNLSEFFTDLSPYYLSFYNSTDQKTYNYKSGRWEKYAAKVIKPGEAAMLRYTSDIAKTRDNAPGTFGFTMKTGLNHIGHSYNGSRNLAWYNTTIASANLITITHQNPETGTLSTFTYGSADNGAVDVLQGCGVEVNVSTDTVISGL